jgi:hypothetical protein
MHEVRVIARAVAQQGKGDELKALLRGLVQPTRAEAGCKYYELFESNLAGIFGVVATSNRKPPLAKMRFCKSLILLRGNQAIKAAYDRFNADIEDESGGRGPFCSP